MKNVLITGAAGQIAYSLIFRIASGELFGPKQSLRLLLLDREEAIGMLQAVEMELHDCAYPLLKDVRIGSDLLKVFKGADVAFMVGAKPRGPGMERKDLLRDNGQIFAEQGEALDKVASRDLITLVVGNPSNTNCLIAMRHAPNLNPHKFFSMMRLDENRARSFLAHKAKVDVTKVQNVAIWGNHSTTQAPDFINTTIDDKPVIEVIRDRVWLENDFVPAVQNRGAEVIAARGKSSAASAANAALYAMHSLLFPTPEGQFFSHGMLSTGNPYGIADDLVFSFPCRSLGDGEVEIVSDLKWDDFLQHHIKKSEEELLEERPKS